MDLTIPVLQAGKIGAFTATEGGVRVESCGAGGGHKNILYHMSQMGQESFQMTLPGLSG